MKRALCDIALVLGAFLLPWWLILAFSIAFFFAFEDFYEFLLAAFLMDLLYGAPEARFLHMRFALSAGAVLLAFLLSFLKGRVRFPAAAPARS